MIGCLTLTLYANVYSQRIVETLPDDQFIVEINGKEYRALNADKIRELLKMKADLETEQKVNTELRSQIKEALLQRDLAAAQRDLQAEKVSSLNADFDRARQDSVRNFELFQSERNLRIESQTFVPHGSKTKFDKFLSLFDSKGMQFAIKGAIPIVNTWLSARCQ